MVVLSSRDDRMHLRDQLIDAFISLMDERIKQYMEGKVPNSQETKLKLALALNDILNLTDDEYQ